MSSVLMWPAAARVRLILASLLTFTMLLTSAFVTVGTAQGAAIPPRRPTGMVLPQRPGLTWTVFSGYLGHQQECQGVQICLKSNQYAIDFHYQPSQDRTIVAPVSGIAHKVVTTGRPKYCVTGLPWNDPGLEVRISVDNSPGWVVDLAHFESISIQDGQHVDQNQPLGVMGQSGCATGVHLHMALWFNGISYPFGSLSGFGDDVFQNVTYQYGSHPQLTKPAGVTATPDPQQAGSITIGGDLSPGGQASFTITVRNDGTAPTPAIFPYLEGDSPGGSWRTSNPQPSSAVIPPNGGQVTFVAQLPLCCTGRYTTSGIFLWDVSNHTYWKPLPPNGTNLRLSFNVTPACKETSPVLTQSLSGSPNPATVSQNVLVTAVVRNDGCKAFTGTVMAGGRGPGGANDVEDFPGTLITIIPGASFTYTAIRSFTTPGAYGFDMGYKDSAGNWFPIYGADGSISRHWDLTVQQPLAHLNLITIPGGSVTVSPPGGSYPVGTVVTLTAIPDPGYTFTGWFIDNTIPSMDNPYQLTMDGDHSVQATFGAVTPTWSSLGGSLADPPAAANFNGRIYVFTKNADGTLSTRSSADGATWADWANVGGNVTSSPAAVSFNGRLYLFARDANNALIFISSADGTTWTAWQSLGGTLTAAPAAATANGVLSVFVRWSDGSLYTMRSTDGVTFGAWQGLGGSLVDPPVATAFQGQIYVFTIQHTVYYGNDLDSLYIQHSADGITFSAPFFNGGEFTSAIGATSVRMADGSERLYMFAEGTNFTNIYVEHTADGTTWSGWLDLGGDTSGQPAAASLNGTVYAFVRWSDNTIHMIALQP